ncbi:hypothetical protein [Pseudomonas sp. URMO17WK12:I11]|uniref:hypothetical protein n=1 Tax=Pseudomonas sp. URMO17WK12:I11 TaxID=1283291 RepID=UPI0011A540C4|nr:hypothetical protein [Pseudomonas sp. URMO17WK12:I11]
MLQDLDLSRADILQEAEGNIGKIHRKIISVERFVFIFAFAFAFAFASKRAEVQTTRNATSGGRT